MFINNLEIWNFLLLHLYPKHTAIFDNNLTVDYADPISWIAWFGNIS